MPASAEIARGVERIQDEFIAAYETWNALPRLERDGTIEDLLGFWNIDSRDNWTQTYHLLKRSRARTLAEGSAPIVMKHGQYALRDNAADHPRLDGFERLTGDWGVTSDWHVPLHDPEMFLRYIAICRRFGIRNHVALGDVFDQPMFSTYGHKPSETFKRELRHVRAVFNWLLQYSDRITWVLGNHDDRIFRVSSGQITTDMLLELVTQDERVSLSEYYHCELTSGDHTYRLTHAKAFSKLRGRVAYDLCAKYRTSVVMAHQHGVGMIPDITGRDMAIDVGGMFDHKKTAYVTMRDSTLPFWAGGFLIVKNGAPYLFSDSLHTDWDYWIDADARAWMDEERARITALPED